MRLFIRHGVEENSCKYPDDPEITANAKVKACELSKELIEKFGQPKYIVSSPYKRARQTALCLSRFIDAQLIIDYRLSKHHGSDTKNIHVRKSSKKFGVVAPESGDKFKKRLRSLMKSYDKNCVVWLITHGTVMLKLNKLYETEYIPFFKPLEYHSM